MTSRPISSATNTHSSSDSLFVAVEQSIAHDEPNSQGVELHSTLAECVTPTAAAFPTTIAEKRPTDSRTTRASPVFAARPKLHRGGSSVLRALQLDERVNPKVGI